MMCFDANKKGMIIKCPYCGYEYTIDEIFVKGELIGQSHRRVKDTFGKILAVDYGDEENEPQLIEHYICDGCDKEFVVEATINCKTKPIDEAVDFKNESVSLLD